MVFDESKILIVIPAYNEAKTIGRVIRGLFEQGFKQVVVVNDGSTDDTAAVAKTAGALVLNHALNRGQGAALQTGHDFAKQKQMAIVVDFDADDQMNPADIMGALVFIKNNEADVVLGSRFLDNRSQIPFFKKYFILPLGRLVNFLLCGLWLTDAHNGFRILNSKALEKINLTQDGMAHATEIIAQIKKTKLIFKEYPVEIKYHKFGQGIGGGFKIIKDLLIGKIL